MPDVYCSGYVPHILGDSGRLYNEQGETRMSKGLHSTRSTHEAWPLLMWVEWSGYSDRPTPRGSSNDLFPGQRWKGKADYSPDGDFEVAVVDLTHDAQQRKRHTKFHWLPIRLRTSASPSILLMTFKFNLGNNQSAFNTAIHHMCALIQFILFLSYF